MATKVKKASSLFSGFSSQRFSLKDQISFIKRLAFLINAGVSAVEALGLLREQTHHKVQGEILDAIIADVLNGQSLSRAFAKAPRVFSQFSIYLIKVGESTGTLSQTLTYLAEELKKSQALRRKVVGAFVYPALITLATLGITAFLVVYLFPKILPVFSSLHIKLPLSTRIVIGLSGFLTHYGLYLLVGIIVFVVGFTVLRARSSQFRYGCDAFILRIPIVGGMLKYYIVANSCRTLGLLLKSGVRMSEALPITADTTANVVYKEHFMKLGEAALRGEKLSSYLRKERRLFPDMLGQMVAVGERSGTLSETLAYLSDLYESEVEEFTKNLSTLVEPVLMIFMGVLVGFVAISIITPIYGITQNLHA